MKAKSLLFISFLSGAIYAQDISMTFSSDDESYTLDSITAMNIRTGETTTIAGDETLILGAGTGIPQLSVQELSSMVYPNPSDGISTLIVNIPEQDEIVLSVRNQLGQLVFKTRQEVQPGPQAFLLSLQSAGLHYISIQHSKGTEIMQLVSIKNNSNGNSIAFTGSESRVTSPESLKSGTDGSYLGYEFGDPLRFYCYGGIHTTIFQDQPREVRDYHYEVDFYPCIDGDGESYPVVLINGLVWMAENLAYLPSVSPPSLEEVDQPHSYVYGYDGSNINEAKASANYKIYGVLYNWEAANASCPEGWHFSTDEDWKNLEAFLGMSEVEQDLLTNMTFRITGDVGNKLKSTEYWDQDGNGLDLVGFRLLPPGWSGDGYFQEIGLRGSFWMSDEYDDNNAIFRSFVASGGGIWKYYGNKKYTASVRCVKD